MRSGRWNTVGTHLVSCYQQMKQVSRAFHKFQLHGHSTYAALFRDPCFVDPSSTLTSPVLRLRLSLWTSLTFGGCFPNYLLFQLFQQPQSPNAVLNALCSEWLLFSSSNPDRLGSHAFLFPNPPLNTHTCICAHTNTHTHILNSFVF